MEPVSPIFVRNRTPSKKWLVQALTKARFTLGFHVSLTLATISTSAIMIIVIWFRKFGFQDFDILLCAGFRKCDSWTAPFETSNVIWIYVKPQISPLKLSSILVKILDLQKDHSWKPPDTKIQKRKEHKSACQVTWTFSVICVWIDPRPM